MDSFAEAILAKIVQLNQETDAPISQLKLREAFAEMDVVELQTRINALVERGAIEFVSGSGSAGGYVPLPSPVLASISESEEDDSDDELDIAEIVPCGGTGSVSREEVLNAIASIERHCGRGARAHELFSAFKSRCGKNSIYNHIKRLKDEGRIRVRNADSTFKEYSLTEEPSLAPTIKIPVSRVTLKPEFKADSKAPDPAIEEQKMTEPKAISQQTDRSPAADGTGSVLAKIVRKIQQQDERIAALSEKVAALEKAGGEIYEELTAIVEDW